MFNPAVAQESVPAAKPGWREDGKYEGSPRSTAKDEVVEPPQSEEEHYIQPRDEETSPVLMPGVIKSPVQQPSHAPSFEAPSPKHSVGRRSSTRSSHNKTPPDQHVINILPNPELLDETSDWLPESNNLMDTNQHSADQPALVTREEYIPVRVARQKVKELCAQMAKVKVQHLQAMERVESHYMSMRRNAEDRLQQYVKTLAAKHEQERIRQAAEHSEKMKRVRAELLGNVDLEVQKAKDKIIELENDQADKIEIARLKLQHEQTLIDEKRGNAERELSQLKETATEKQREAEATLAREREEHKQSLEDTQLKANQQLEVLKSDMSAKLAEEASQREREREAEFNRHLQEAELRFSAKQSELKIEMESTRKEANAASDLAQAARKHGEKTKKNLQRYHTEGQETAKMSQEDQLVSFLATKALLDSEIKDLSTRLADLQKQHNDQQTLLSAADTKSTEHTAEITKLISDRDAMTATVAALELQIKKTHEEHTEAAKATVATEAELLQKTEALEKLKRQSHTLKEQGEANSARILELEELLTSTRKHNSDVVSDLRSKIAETQKKHQQEKEKAVQLALLSLNGDSAAVKERKDEAAAKLQHLIEAAQQQAEAVAEQKRMLEDELVETTENLQKSEERRAELQAALQSEAKADSETEAIAQQLRQKDEEVAALKQKIADHQHSINETIAAMATNLSDKEQHSQKLKSEYQQKLQPLREQLTTTTASLTEAKKNVEEIEANMSSLDHESPEYEEAASSLEAAESEVSKLQSETVDLKKQIHQLEVDGEKASMSLGIEHSKYDKNHIAQHHNLVTEMTNLTTAKRAAAQESNKLRAQLCTTSDTDTDEAAKIKQQLADQQEKVETREAALENLQKGNEGIWESQLKQCQLIREKNDAEAYIKELDRVADIQSGESQPIAAVAASSSGGDPELQAKYDRDKKAFKDKEAALKKQLQKQQSAMEDLEKAAGNSAGLAKENTALTEKTKKLESDIKSQKKKYKELQASAGEAAQLKEEVVLLRKTTKESKKHADECEAMWKTETALRKKYFNEIQDLKGKIRVMVRCRPMNSIEKKKESKTVVQFPDEYSMVIPVKKKEFLFDHVFSTESTQDQVWNESKHFVQSAIDGYNTCIFAYGQTGSGKTFTMEGSMEHPGLTPRCINELYETLESMSSRLDYSISCYMLELYTDNLYDLLLDKKLKKNAPSLDIKKDPKGMIMINGATICPAAKREDLALLYMEGCKSRHVRATGMNATSSRSHLVFGILIETQHKGTGKVTTGKMSLVDLAGSERMEKNRHQGRRWSS
eukprot:TRINITY_DN2823_c0_g6_i1.p1 TRINITY_DN2823_c0_g6~~TRINITY_DN2823_c0_g6_i1.p1  ORF type:complete len:1297 (+),score=395.20 TRINITY_DN2823_c0_g6_i1:128-4018(+)